MGKNSLPHLRVLPLCAALSIALVADPAWASGPDAVMPATWRAGDHSGVAALMQALRDRRDPQRAVAAAPTPAPVTRCDDDGLPGSLRGAIAAAGDGASIDLSNLACSVITLSQGAIPVFVDDLTLIGPGAQALAIDGAAADRVFVHYGYGALTLDEVSVRNGVNRVSGFHVAGGACIISNGSVVLDHSVVSGCTSAGEGAYGGGILSINVGLYASRLSGNVSLGANPDTFTAAYGGGAFAYRGVARLYASTVSGNRAAHDPTDTDGSYCTGGGVFSDNGGSAYASTFSANYSYGTGGGIASHAGFGLAQSTISGNTARHKGGGGLFVRLFDSLTIDNSTIADNLAATGGGVYVSGLPRAVTLRSSLLADNVAASGADIAAQQALTIAGSNNLVLASANVGLPADTIAAPPLLLPLADNGGPTATQAPTPASPVLDAGSNPNGFVYDQRGPGYSRTLGPAPDIGAFEGALAAAVPEPVPALSGRLRWLLAVLLALGGRLFLRRDTI